MEELQNYIGSYFDTKAEDSRRIADLFTSTLLKKDEFHTKHGQRHATLSFVKSGVLRIHKQTDRKEVTQWISTSGEFVTELGALMFDQPARWNIQALTDCELFTLSHTDYLSINEHISNWAEIEKLFLSKCFMSIEDRVFSFLSMTTEERYAYLCEVKPEVIQQVPQQYIASMLGMTPETLSRVRRKIIS